MPSKNNPFKPTQPIFRDMFTGRINEINRIESVLLETKDGNPTNLLIIGERGIGKTSLLLLSKFLASSNIPIDDDVLNFMTLFISIDRRTNINQFAIKMNRELKRQLRNHDKAIQFTKDIWQFVQRIEIGGSKIGPQFGEMNEAEVFENFMYSMIDTVKSIVSPGIATSKLGLRKPKDGVVILIDEADNAPPELDLGSLLKLMSERLVIEDCNNILVILSGLPGIRTLLQESHGSSLRLFEELELFPLSSEEVKNVIRLGLEEANKKNKIPVKITKEALSRINTFSEGYPHFVQQFGYSSYAFDEDNNITKNDVDNAAFSPGGAYDLIGDRYYKEMYFSKIKQDSYRQVLKIMSNKWNQWVSKKEIRSKFKGKETTLTNALKALYERKVILRRPGTLGEYRLQWLGFALWISIFAERLEKDIGLYNGLR